MEDAMLGKMPDLAIAAKLGVYRATVAKRRKELGIKRLERAMWSTRKGEGWPRDAAAR